MAHAEHVRLINQLLHQIDTDTNVDAGCHLHTPVADYLDPGRARQEWRTFFQHAPNAMGLSLDLPGPGSFMTSDALGKPILMTRDRDGQFRAFLNVCRHRGTVIESEPRGRKNVFTCPFHAWAYSSGGDLVAVPKEDHFGAVERACNSLVELPSAERHGLLFVSAEPGADFDIDALLGAMGPELAQWHLGLSEPLWRTRYDTAMNWKLAIDTFGETYHFESLHKDTLASTIRGNCQAYDTFGRHHRMLLTYRGIDELRSQPEEHWHLLHATLPVYYLFPNVQLIIGQDGPTLVRVYPERDDPHRSFSEIDFYHQPGLLERLGYTLPPEADRQAIMEERARGFAEVIQQEDYVAAAASHAGARSGAISHFTFGRNEPALHHYHQTYREALNLPPLTSVPA